MLEEMRSAISYPQLELINRLTAGEMVPAGTTLKRVRGFNPNPRERR